jgi:ethanolaminephosphotransferase
MHIPEENLPNLANHQFKSTGYSLLDSFLNKFIWEPLVSLFPRWLAPNLVTVVGLIFMMASYLIMLGVDDTFKISIPAEMLFAAAFCQFMYQTLDACDGKQARRLGLASPLGMLMDHGCDSISCTFIILSIVQAMNMGINNDSLFLFMTVYTGFYLTHWEEYHTHYHRTHMFNWGVTEGQWTNITLLILTGLYSPSIWQQIFYEYTLRSILVYANCAWGIFVSVMIIGNTLSKSSGLLPIFRLVPLIVQNISLYYWFQTSLITNFAPAIIITHGLIYAEICSKLIICSTAKMSFRWVHLNTFLELALVLELTYVKFLPPTTSLFIFCAYYCLMVL